MDYFNSVNIEFYKIDKFGYIIYNQPKNQGKLISFAPCSLENAFVSKPLKAILDVIDKILQKILSVILCLRGYNRTSINRKKIDRLY